MDVDEDEDCRIVMAAIAAAGRMTEQELEAATGWRRKQLDVALQRLQLAGRIEPWSFPPKRRVGTGPINFIGVPWFMAWRVVPAEGTEEREPRRAPGAQRR